MPKAQNSFKIHGPIPIFIGQLPYLEWSGGMETFSIMLPKITASLRLHVPDCSRRGGNGAKGECIRIIKTSIPKPEKHVQI